MKNKLTSKLEWSVTARWIVCAGIACATVGTVHAQWYFDIGPAYRGDMKISVRGGTRALEDSANADGSVARGHRGAPSGNLPNDDGSAQIARRFDDGHVDPSGWGWARIDGTTQAWGYDSPGQYDAGADTL